MGAGPPPPADSAAGPPAFLGDFDGRMLVRVLRIASRGGVRSGFRTRDETPLMTRDRLYVTGTGGTEVRTVPGGRIVRRLPAPASAYEVWPSPDGRRFAMTNFTPNLRNRSFLVDARSRVARSSSTTAAASRSTCRTTATRST